MKLRIFVIFLSLVIFNPSVVEAATLSLSPSTGTFNKGCQVVLEVKLDTQGEQTDATDAIVLYDQSKFSASSITSGSIYADYPGNNIDETTGKVTISGLASVSSAFSGQGTLATINFTVKDTAGVGATIVRFDFDPNDKTKTTDSNVVQRGTVAEILSSVVNGNYTIGSGTCGAAPGGTVGTLPGTGRGAVSTPSAQPKTIDDLVDQTGKGPGTAELTYTIAIVGSILTILGILGLAFL